MQSRNRSTIAGVFLVFLSVFSVFLAAGEVVLEWDPSADADVYYVQRSLVSDGPYTTISPALNSTSFVDESVTAGTTYYYVVYAENAHGSSGSSNEVSATPRPLFVRGDGNGDQRVDITDTATVLSCLFSGLFCPQCLDSADCNDDGVVDITDAVCVLGCIFGSGSCPSSPFPDCGVDETSDSLDCAQYQGCA